VLSGSIKVNGRPSHDVEYRQAYVQQEDAFFSMLTAEEVG
jgi:ABC-type multidrug transport system ATPase subunit